MEYQRQWDLMRGDRVVQQQVGTAV
jgi:hypothetical protein